MAVAVAMTDTAPIRSRPAAAGRILMGAVSLMVTATAIAALILR